MSGEASSPWADANSQSRAIQEQLHQQQTPIQHPFLYQIKDIDRQTSLLIEKENPKIEKLAYQDEMKLEGNQNNFRDGIKEKPISRNCKSNPYQGGDWRAPSTKRKPISQLERQEWGRGWWWWSETSQEMNPWLKWSSLERSEEQTNVYNSKRMERGWVKTKMVILKRTGLMMPKRQR